MMSKKYCSVCGSEIIDSLCLCQLMKKREKEYYQSLEEEYYQSLEEEYYDDLRMEEERRYRLRQEEFRNRER